MNNFFLRGAVLIAAAAFLFVLINPTSVKADEWDLATIFSVNQQVEIPGDKVLQPNTKYLIKLMDSPANRGIVQVFNEDRTHLLSTFMAIPEIRPEATDHTVFEFMEVPAGNPVPIRSWFYPGRKTGLEFLYPKQQREKFAAYTAKPVKTSIETAQAVVAEPAPTEPLHNEVAQNQPVENAPLLNEEPAIAKAEPPTQEIDRSKPTEPEQTVTQAPPPEPQETTTPRELPHTSGALGLVALMGALSAAAGLGSRWVRK